MKLASLLLIASTVCGLAATEENLSRKFPAQAGGKLDVDVDFGAIEVTTNNTSEVTVEIHRKVGRKSQADEEAYLKAHPVVFTQEGNLVSIKVERKKIWNWSGAQRNEGKYVITVPSKYSAQLATSGGAVMVTGLTGETTANTSGGSLKFTRLTGPLDSHTSGGSIQVTDCDGKLRVGTSGGGIDVRGGSGTLDGSTSGGSVSVKDFRGLAHVETSGGGINIENVAGKVEGSTSGGSISAILPSVAEGVRLETSGGGVRVKVPANAAFDLDAATSGGVVTSDIDVAHTGKRERTSLKGTVNGGGKTILLRTSGGNIHIEKL
ncbi:MAG TPA: DUF4097 family beta strand repeat-containing protein [Verrucomicrobiae bacterium]|nr:DUF4097 family beta strand repeat-containing protein [Verrucomicrobiae bacterium]